MMRRHHKVISHLVSNNVKCIDLIILPIIDLEWIKQQRQSVGNARQDKMNLLCLWYDAAAIRDGGDFLFQVKN